MKRSLYNNFTTANATDFIDPIFEYPGKVLPGRAKIQPNNGPYNFLGLLNFFTISIFKRKSVILYNWSFLNNMFARSYEFVRCFVFKRRNSCKFKNLDLDKSVSSDKINQLFLKEH